MGDSVQAQGVDRVSRGQYDGGQGPRSPQRPRSFDATPRMTNSGSASSSSGLMSVDVGSGVLSAKAAGVGCVWVVLFD